MGLGAIFDDEQIMLFPERRKRIHIRRLAVQMHHKDRLGLRRYFRFELLHIEIVIRIRLDKNRGRAINRNPHHTSNVGIAQYRDPVAGANAQQAQRNSTARPSR